MKRLANPDIYQKMKQINESKRGELTLLSKVKILQQEHRTIEKLSYLCLTCLASGQSLGAKLAMTYIPLTYKMITT